MKFKYVGPHDAVDLAGHGEVKHGKTVDVTADAAKSLDAQADWQRVAPPKKRAAKKTAPKPPAAAADKNEE